MVMNMIISAVLVRTTNYFYNIIASLTNEIIKKTKNKCPTILNYRHNKYNVGKSKNQIVLLILRKTNRENRIYSVKDYQLLLRVNPNQIFLYVFDLIIMCYAFYIFTKFKILNALLQTAQKYICYDSVMVNSRWLFVICKIFFFSDFYCQ